MTLEDQSLEVAKEGVKSLLAPIADIIKSLLGPSADEIGMAGGDWFRVWRLRRTIPLLTEVAKIASDAGLQLNPVAPRLLFPLLETASLQDDEDLHRRWIALLANAATHRVEVHPCFPEILGQLTSQEAQFLDQAYDEDEDLIYKNKARLENPHIDIPYDFTTAYGISGGILSSIESILIDNLERLNLVNRSDAPLTVNGSPIHISPHTNHLYITKFGKRFVEVCRIPAPKR
jgi:hypothetical protein